jgi:hypothetical protein
MTFGTTLVLQQNMVQTAVLPSVILGLNHSYNVHYCKNKGGLWMQIISMSVYKANLTIVKDYKLLI